MREPHLVSADDRGLLLGDGLFETVRLYDGRAFRLESHLRRLEMSAEELGIPAPSSLRERIVSAIADFGGGDGALRITLTRGVGSGLVPPAMPHPSLFLALHPLPPIVEESAIGIRARLFGRLDERALTSGHKAIGYLERIQALRYARKEGADEALLRNSRGLMVEGSASNLFAVEGRVLLAPGVTEGALPGITRQVLLELAPRIELTVDERGIRTDKLPEISEIFVSSSLREVAPVVEVEGDRVGEGRPGPVYLALKRLFREVVLGELER